MTLPTVPFGEHQISRLIIGGNPLCGNSHYSDAMSKDMRTYYTPEQVVEVLQQCEAVGINAVQARGDYHRILYWLELARRAGNQMHWIAQTASEMHDLKTNIRVIAAFGAIGIYWHGSRTDNMWHEGRIDEVQDYLKCMRDSGVQVGLGSHQPEVFEYVEEKGWDIDFYMTCLYNLNRQKRESALVSGVELRESFYEEDPPRMIQVVQNTDKTCLVFKILAAGRLCEDQEQVRQAFQWTFDNIKAKDAVVVGMFPKYEDQIELNVQHTLAVLSQG